MSRRSGAPAARQRAVPAVALDGVVKAYGDAAAFECDELEVADGESVVLIGHNGSGKTTLLNLLAGTLEPTEGEVRVHGRPPGSLEARAARSWLPDAPVLYDDLSVIEHLRFTNRMHGGAGDDEQLRALADRIGLEGRHDDLPSRFSRGLRQKTAIAVALCRPFSLLLVDEPFVGLDAAGRSAFLDLLDVAAADGATLIVATHDPAVTERFDRALLLEQGRVVSDEPASTLERHALDAPAG